MKLIGYTLIVLGPFIVLAHVVAGTVMVATGIIMCGMGYHVERIERAMGVTPPPYQVPPGR